MIDYESLVEKLDFAFRWVHIDVDVGRMDIKLEVHEWVLRIAAGIASRQQEQQHEHQQEGTECRTIKRRIRNATAAKAVI